MEVFSNNVGEATFEAVITRADGTVEDLGVIASYKRSWWRTLLRKFSQVR